MANFAPPAHCCANMTADFLVRTAEVLGDGYIVERDLGGGMSRVVVARDVALGRRVVVKMLPVDRAAGISADRFRREVVLAAGLQHPHIVPLLTASTTSDGTLFYTMPYVEGQSLRSRLGLGVPPLRDTLRWLRDVASALSYAHARGVVHRDMKPDNILLSDDYAVVADFGIAKALMNASATLARQPAAVDALTSVGMALGTPAYMAPEQIAADADADHRTDLYALGVIAYELLTGATPFVGSPQAILAAHLTRAPEPIQNRREGLPDALCVLIMQCLAKEAVDRPSSADEVIATLQSILSTITADGTQPTPQRATRTSEQALAGSRKVAFTRKRIVTAAVVAVAIAVGAYTVVTSRDREPQLMPRRVAVATFRDATPDSSLRELARTISGGIADALSAVDGSDVVARDVVERIESAIAHGAFTPQLLATRLRAGLVVSGIVSAAGRDSVRISVSLAAGDNGQVIRKLGDVVAPRSDVRGAMDDVHQRLSGAIIMVSGGDFTRSMLPRADPPRFAALVALRDGLQLEAGLRQPDAKEDENEAEMTRFDRAFALDTGFSQARLWFASAALRRPGGEAYADSALSLVASLQDGLTEYERALLDALRADEKGNHELSVRAWRRASVLAPAWPNRWWLAMKLRDANRPREALAIVDSLGRVNANFLRSVPGLRHYLTNYADEYRALQSERLRAPSTAQSLGFQQALLQSLAALDSLPLVAKLLDNAAQLPAEPGSSLAFLLVRTSWELAAHGHASEAESALKRAASWCGRRTAKDLSNGNVAFDCMEAYAYAGNLSALAALAEPALRNRPDDVDLAILGVLGLAAALHGERELATKYAARIELVTRVDGSHGLGSWLRARVSGALGDQPRAVELLEDAFARGAGWSQRLDLHRDPAFAKLRGDSGFERLRQPQG